MRDAVDLSIVLPVFNEEDVLPTLWERLSSTLPDVAESCEVIFVDDGSKDRTFKKIQEMAAGDDRVRGIQLSRNFGHQIAILAGLNEAKGERILMMDADGQHPPSLIKAMRSRSKSRSNFLL